MDIGWSEDEGTSDPGNTDDAIATLRNLAAKLPVNEFQQNQTDYDDRCYLECCRNLRT